MSELVTGPVTPLRELPPQRPFTLVLAARIRGEMAERRLHQADLARALGITQQSVSKRLNGKVPFDVNELADVAAFLGVSIGRLLGEYGDANPPPGGMGLTRDSHRYLRRLRDGLSPSAPATVTSCRDMLHAA